MTIFRHLFGRGKRNIFRLNPAHQQMDISKLLEPLYGICFKWRTRPLYSIARATLTHRGKELRLVELFAKR
jgi:hypothetical protein